MRRSGALRRGLVVLAGIVLYGLSAPVVVLAEEAPSSREATAETDAPAALTMKVEDWMALSPRERRRLRAELRHRYLDASPEERDAMRGEMGARARERLEEAPIAEHRRKRMLMRLERFELARELWDELPEEDRRALRREMRGAGPGDRARLREHVENLPPEKRREIAERLKRLRSLDAERREALADRLAELESLPEADRERIRRNHDRWNAMSPEDRERMRAHLRRLREMDPEERLELLDRLANED